MLKHLGSVGLGRGLRAVTQAVLLILLARDVGPHGFGVIAAFLAAHTVLFVVAGMGTPTFVTREIALGDVARALASIRLNSLVMSVAIVLALASCVPLADHPLLLFAVAGNAIGLWTERVTENRLAVAYGEQHVRGPVVTLLVQALAPLLVYIGLGAAGVETLVAFAIARVIGGVASQLIASLLIRLPASPALVRSRTIARAQASFAINIAMAMIRSLDSVIIIALAGATVSGIYSAVSRVVAPFTILATSVAPILVPRAALASSARMRRRLNHLLAAGLVLSMSTLLLAPFTESLVIMAFGREFAGGGAVLFWTLLRGGPEVVTPLIAAALQARGLDRLVALVSAATSVLTLTAVAVGVFLGGATGAAKGFTAVSVVGMVTFWFVAHRSIGPEARAA